jgi:hypothetical protein
MSKKKFTQDIADILADDLATLESIEPGAILRPELMRGPTPPAPAEVSNTTAAPEAAAPPAPEPEPAITVEAVVPAVPEASLDHADLDGEQTPLPLVVESDVDQPELFATPTETPASLPETPSSLPPEPATPAPAASRSRREPQPEPSRASAPKPAAAARGNPGGDHEGAGGGSGSDSTAEHGDDGGSEFTDSVTLVEITPPEDGGIRERALPGDRSLSPPAPPKARRGWNHPVARWTFYVLVVVGLTAIFLFLLVEIFHLG